MDDIVKQAMAKWPNVPDCYGWLALDARGVWRMRDERAQQLNLPGDKVHQAALLNFINRNYEADARGCWYFQNGPQRVFVDLEATPYIARTDPAQGLTVQTGQAITPEAAFMTAAGALIVTGGAMTAQVDDRDVVQLLSQMSLGDDALMAWLAGGPGEVTMRLGNADIAVERIDGDSVPARFGFRRLPRAAPSGSTP